MNVFGIGVDLVEVSRIDEAIQRHGIRFLDRVFTAEEQQYCGSHSNSGPHYAARFAAKEAVSKALGTGIGKEAGLLEIEVTRESSGAPVVVLSGHAAAYAAQVGVTKILLSLSHTSHSAVAQVMALMDS